MKIMFRIPACVCLAIVCLASAGAAAQETGEALALVAEVRGEAELYLAGEEVWVPAEAGMDVFAGDRIRTGRGSSVLLLLGSGETLRVPEKSSVDFSAPSGERPSALGGLLRGLWDGIARKFADAQDAEVASGLVGALRGPAEEGDLSDRQLPAGEKERLDREIALLEEHLEEGGDRAMLLGILYEEHRQYASAEGAYLRAIELTPGEEHLYDLLLDLYLDAGAYDRLERIRRLKEDAPAGQKSSRRPGGGGAGGS